HYNNKIKDITFSYDKVLSFEGETSVYVQYTCARANSVLIKSGEKIKLPPEYVPNTAEFEVIKALEIFPRTVLEAGEKYEPSLIARYAVDLSQKFNKFYIECKILTETGDTKAFRLALTSAVYSTLKNALALLGIGAPEKM
ncbi:MAG: arginine--tRNA ligase, partial [Clostridia bacterium]|nr:arginine--tRNA ligase [Clostridia bacterium]